MPEVLSGADQPDEAALEQKVKEEAAAYLNGLIKNGFGIQDELRPYIEKFAEADVVGRGHPPLDAPKKEINDYLDIYRTFQAALPGIPDQLRAPLAEMVGRMGIRGKRALIETIPPAIERAENDEQRQLVMDVARTFFFTPGYRFIDAMKTTMFSSEELEFCRTAAGLSNEYSRDQLLRFANFVRDLKTSEADTVKKVEGMSTVLANQSEWMTKSDNELTKFVKGMKAEAQDEEAQDIMEDIFSEPDGEETGSQKSE